MPLTLRGAGTSIAGNAMGAGIVVDTLRHLRRELAGTRGADGASCSPGPSTPVAKRGGGPGLRFGPDPSTTPVAPSAG